MANNLVTVIFLILLTLIFMNWISGYLATVFSSRYEPQESFFYLGAHGLKLVKVIRTTEKYQKQSDVLTDSRSLFRKIYSTRSLYIVIAYSEYEKKNIILWVELVKSWNSWFSKERSLKHSRETNNVLINFFQKEGKGYKITS